MSHNKKYFTRFVCGCQYKISRIIIFYVGGHLGFSKEQLADIKHMDYDSEIKKIINCTKTYEEKFKKHIPVIVAAECLHTRMSCTAWSLEPTECRWRAVLWRQRSVTHRMPTSSLSQSATIVLRNVTLQKVPYCITKALIAAVKGDMQNGLVFCGANVGHINRITTVHELMSELVGA